MHRRASGNAKMPNETTSAFTAPGRSDGPTWLSRPSIFIHAAFSMALIQYVCGFALSGTISCYPSMAAILFGFYRIQNLPCRRKKTRSCRWGFSGSTFSAALAISWLYFDTSHDGQYDHQEALIQLAEGWIPFGKLHALPAGFPSSSITFPKLHGLVSATIYKGTGFVEGAKRLNILLIVASFFAVDLFYFHLIASKGKFNFISSFLALNRSQFARCYHHGRGILYSLILDSHHGTLALFTKSSDLHLLFAGRRHLLINVKLSGLIYFLSLACSYIVYVHLKHRDISRTVAVDLVLAAIF